jgi:acyl-CoA synthetase (AMP-forming)/AMP-acid ligase II
MIDSDIPIGFFDGEREENNVLCFLERHARRDPQRLALSWVPKEAMADWDGTAPLHHATVACGELFEQTGRAAAGLARLGIERGDRVIVFLPMTPELYVAMFAVQRLGAVAVFLDSWARRDQLGATASTVAPKGMISFEGAFSLCAAVPELASIPVRVVAGPHEAAYAGVLEEFLAETSTAPVAPVCADSSALITFTTGSSGTPKGAVRSHGFLAAQHRALDGCIPYEPGDRDLPVFPIFSLNNLAAGVPTILPAIDLAAPAERDGAILAGQLRTTSATCCTLSPSLFVRLAEECVARGETLPHLRRAVTGGAPVSRDSIARFREIAPAAEIMVLYGSTEVEPIAHIEAAEILADNSEREGVLVGRISGELRHRFIRIDHDPVELGDDGWDALAAPSGAPGELIVSGAHVCGEYYHNPEAFRRAKIRDRDGKVWHRTGDVGTLDEEGRLWLVGRVHNVILRDGTPLFPVRAEILLKRLPFVNQAAYLGLADAKLGEKACAVVSLREDHRDDDRQRYREEVFNWLTHHNIPVDGVRIVDAIPMDARHYSKVEYARLREILA